MPRYTAMIAIPTRSTAKSARPFNTWDALKLLGLICMIADHAAFFFLDRNPLLRVVGQPAIAIFLFLTGYAPHRRIPAELLLAAALMVAINTYVSGLSTLNILFTIIAGRLLLQQVDAGRIRLERPLEWLVVLVLLFPTVLLVQTGTIGLMLVLCGYLQQHKQRYPVRIRAWFFALSFGLYALIDAYALHFTLPYALLLFASMSAMGWLLWKTEIRPLRVPAEPLLKFLARHMLWVYVIHFGGLQLLTGKGY